MLTRCPQCGTTFRVSPQQLKVHHGEVRCGRCAAVFDAFDTLLDGAVEPPAADGAATGSHVAAPAGEERPAPQPLAAADAPPPIEAGEDGDTPAELRPAADPVPLAVSSIGPGSLAYPWAREDRPRRRWPWVLLALIAAVSLLLQATYRYRSELVVLWPESRPWLERACAELRCAVALPRHVELVGIDASDLQVDTAHANLIVLTATLKNRAPFAQEYPLLTLTLTDTQDQPIARRVLAPADYLDRKTAPSSGFAANAELALKVFVDSRDVKATGYRLFLFYP